jgi:hypothetical protein
MPNVKYIHKILWVELDDFAMDTESTEIEKKRDNILRYVILKEFLKYHC